MVKPSTSAATLVEGDRNNDANEAKYRGVRKRKWGKWVSEIRLPNSRERIWLGSYDSAEKAARAFDAALFCLRGNNANFNFPNQPPDIPGGTDLHPSQIQEAAAHYANSYSNDHEFSLNQPSDDNVNAYEDLQNSSSSFMDVVSSSSSSCSFMMDYNNPSINNIPDYGIFPGFDDYFMTHQATFSAAADYGSEDQVVYDEGMYSQDPTILWNF
ncbi:ethylene-responsive transcription factor ERF017-like protein [Tanacetum coccineum]